MIHFGSSIGRFEDCCHCFYVELHPGQFCNDAYSFSVKQFMLIRFAVNVEVEHRCEKNCKDTCYHISVCCSCTRTSNAIIKQGP